jgi:hypothetical protein
MVVAMMVGNRLPVVVASPAFAVLVGVVVLFLEVWRRSARAATPLQARLRDLSEYGLILIAIGVLGAVASYQVAAVSRGFCDDTLQRWDEALHFDWLGLYALVVRHPLLQVTGSAAYNAVFIYPWAILIWHSWKGERAQAREFLLTFWLAAVITLVLFPLFPARGALSHLWHGAVPYAPSNGLDQGTVIAALRAHRLAGIELSTVTGLVSAPSFHTVCGLLFITFSWRIAQLRPLIVPLNLVLLAATPIEGSHYLVDMVIGAGVAGLAFAVVRKRLALLAWAQGLPPGACAPPPRPAEAGRAQRPAGPGDSIVLAGLHADLFVADRGDRAEQGQPAGDAEFDRGGVVAAPIGDQFQIEPAAEILAHGDRRAAPGGGIGPHDAQAIEADGAAYLVDRIAATAAAQRGQGRASCTASGAEIWVIEVPNSKRLSSSSSGSAGVELNAIEVCAAVPRW